ETGWLLDFYGPLLTKRQQALLHMHYEEDLSLAEIAAQEGISRQGVHDAVRRGEQQLLALEARLGLLTRYRRMHCALEICQEKLVDLVPAPGSEQALLDARQTLMQMLADEEEYHGL
ncbi:MAG: sigma factor-like helix-turn-helix DNA-binding protein, partial [Clostridia bacterium]